MATPRAHHPHVGTARRQDLIGPAVQAWVAPVLAAVDGMDLDLPVVDGWGRPVAATRREYLAGRMSKALWDFNERLTAINDHLSGADRAQALRVVHAEMDDVRKQAIEVCRDGVVWTAAAIERKGVERVA